MTAQKFDELGLRSPRSGTKPVFAVLGFMADLGEPGTRLAIVDAGLAPAGLRARYPDRTRYAIVPAVARRYDSPKQAGHAGSISIEPRYVYVPREYVGVFTGLEGSPAPVSEPRYSATLCFSSTGDLWCAERGTTE